MNSKRNPIWSFTALALAIFISGCATPITPPAKRHALFVESEFAPYLGNGTCTVTGQAFLKTRGGEVRFGAGCEVALIPVTAYTKEVMDRAVLRGELLEPPDPRYSQYRRSTTADGNGNFEFLNLPAGSYYASCLITWEYPTQFGPATTGGVAYGNVTVSAGQSGKVILTR